MASLYPIIILIFVLGIVYLFMRMQSRKKNEKSKDSRFFRRR